MLKLLSREGHPHLNSLLTTYHQNKRFYLVFHWAEWDLWKYWEKHDPRLYGGDDCSVFWMVRECAGLASSLLKIHGPHDPASFAHQNSFDTDIAEMTVTGTKTPGNATASAAEPPAPKLCHHGDIKAINILVFSRPDTPPPASSQASSQAAWPRHVDWTLKISDFGMAGFHNPGRAQEKRRGRPLMFRRSGRLGPRASTSWPVTSGHWGVFFSSSSAGILAGSRWWRTLKRPGWPRTGRRLSIIGSQPSTRTAKLNQP